MTAATTLTELKRAILDGSDTIVVTDPSLCLQIITKQQTRPLRSRLLVYATCFLRYRITTTTLLGDLRVEFKRQPAAAVAAARTH